MPVKFDVPPSATMERSVRLRSVQSIAIDLETTGLSPWKSRIAVIAMLEINQPVVLHSPQRLRVYYVAILQNFGRTSPGIPHPQRDLRYSYLERARMKVYDVEVGGHPSRANKSRQRLPGKASGYRPESNY